MFLIKEIKNMYDVIEGELENGWEISIECSKRRIRKRRWGHGKTLKGDKEAAVKNMRETEN